MRQNLFKLSILLLTFTSMAATQSQSPDKPNPFKSGQSVYLMVMKGNCSPYFAGERELRHEFEKLKVFKIASSMQAADFIFLVYFDIGIYDFEYKRLYAFAVSPATYTKYKTDLYNLRDEALWISEKDDYLNYKTIVKLFHDNVLKK